MLSYTRYPEIDFTHFVSTGETTIQNWLEIVIDYGSWGMTSREFYDIRHQTNLFSNEEVNMIINRSVMVEHLHPPTGRTAVLVDSVYKYGLAKIYALKAKNHRWLPEVQVFFTLGEVIDWLGYDVAKCL